MKRTKDGLPKANDWMFEVVESDAYLMPVKDGRHIWRDPGTDDFYYVYGRNDESYVKVSDTDIGGSDFIKTLYVRNSHKTRGVVIGMKMVTVKEELYVDHFYEDYGIFDGVVDYYYVDKHPTETEKCLVVAYGCNKTRLVPIKWAKIKNERR